MPDITFFSAIRSLAKFLYDRKKGADETTRKTIENFEKELKEFFDNVLGWYNKIVLFTENLVNDAKIGKLTHDIVNDYLGQLAIIKRSDQFLSKCEVFINRTVVNFRKEKPFNDEESAERLYDLQSSYRHFKETILGHKLSVRRLLHGWEDASDKERVRIIEQIETEMQRIEAAKKGVRESIIRLSHDS